MNWPSKHLNEVFKHAAQRAGADLLVVLGCDLGHHPNRAAHVAAQELLEALQAGLGRQAPEEAEHKVRVGELRVAAHAYQRALDVLHVGVVLHRALRQPRPLAQLPNRRAVVVAEHFVLQDGVGDLGRPAAQVHLEQLGLEVAFFGAVVLERLEQKRRGFLDAVRRHEQVHHARGLHQLRRRELLGELERARRVLPRQALEHVRVVRPKAHFGGVGDNLVELAALEHAVDGLLHLRKISCAARWRKGSTKSIIERAAQKEDSPFILDSDGGWQGPCFCAREVRYSI
jgi:hypothetical protein